MGVSIFLAEKFFKKMCEYHDIFTFVYLSTYAFQKNKNNSPHIRMPLLHLTKSTSFLNIRHSFITFFCIVKFMRKWEYNLYSNCT